MGTRELIWRMLVHSELLPPSLRVLLGRSVLWRTWAWCGVSQATSRDWSLRREVQQGQVLSTIWSSWQGNLLRSVHGTREHPCSIVLCGWSCAHGRIPALQFSFPRHSFGLLANLAARAGQADAACL